MYVYMCAVYLFETVSNVVQPGLELAISLRMTLNL